MKDYFPYIWIEREYRKMCLKYSARAIGIRAFFDSNISESLKREINSLIKYLRGKYYFPVRCNIHITNHKRYRSEVDGHIFYGAFYDNEGVYERRFIYPEIYVAGEVSRYLSTEQVLFTILHELTHYYQWFFGEDDKRSDLALEQEATRWANAILENYKQTRDLNTPFGRLRIFVDGVEVSYLPIAVDYPYSPCDDKPIAACYRIRGRVPRGSEVRCLIDNADNAENYAESGEDYLSQTFEDGFILLTLGAEDVSDKPRPDYYIDSIKNGLKFTVLDRGTTIVLGVAWVTDNYEDDCRTWFAADPTLHKGSMHF